MNKQNILAEKQINMLTINQTNNRQEKERKSQYDVKSVIIKDIQNTKYINCIL